MKLTILQSILVMTSVLVKANNFVSDDMVNNSRVLICYEAGSAGYLWPLLTYKCTLRPRGVR